jgi:hypothetical protein
MAERELTDEEVFGPQPKPGELSDREVFGDPRDWGAERLDDPRSWGAIPTERPDLSAVDLARGVN